MDRLSIVLNEDKTAFAPRDTVQGTIEWNLEKNPRCLDLSLFWYTAGKGTRFPLNIAYITIDGDGNVVLEIYSINNLLTADGSWLNAWGELRSYYSSPKKGTFEGEFIFTGGTGKFEGATGQGTFRGTHATEDDPIQYVAVGRISTVGSLKRSK